MQIIRKTYKGYKPLYPIDRFCDVDKALFVDIETTGLKKETTSLYLIGCGHYTEEGFETTLFFADRCEEEHDILLRFADFVKGFTSLLHFNGLKFDIPYLSYKAQQYDMEDPFASLTQIDVYKLCAPLRYLLFQDTMRQKAIEGFLGIKRDDRYGGGELIPVYKDYEAYGRDEDLTLLVTHNREDVLGMHLIMPILYYLDLKDAPLKFISYRISDYTDFSGQIHSEVIFEYTTDVYFPLSFSTKTESMYVKASSDDGKILIRLPIYDTEMRLFYDNYRDYRYLPEEDMAVFKTVAQTLPKDRYIKATRENCYRKVSGRFLKQPGDHFQPSLRSSYKDKRRYFRFPEDFDEKTADEFGRKLINVFFTMKRVRSPI